MSFHVVSVEGYLLSRFIANVVFFLYLFFFCIVFVFVVVVVVFFFSPDSGISIHWLTSFSGNSTITVFTSSPFDGTFAFLTDNQEVRLTSTVLYKLTKSNSNV